MTFTFTSVLALGLDGFIACACLGTLRFGWTRSCLLATMCGASDALATAAGAAYGLRASWENLIPGIVAAWLLVVLLSGRRAKALAFSMPIPLALDNLIAGASHGLQPSPADIAVVGAVSASCAFAGLCLGAGLARFACVRRAFSVPQQARARLSLLRARGARESIRGDSASLWW